MAIPKLVQNIHSKCIYCGDKFIIDNYNTWGYSPNDNRILIACPASCMELLFDKEKIINYEIKSKSLHIRSSSDEEGEHTHICNLETGEFEDSELMFEGEVFFELKEISQNCINSLVNKILKLKTFK